MTHYLNNFWEKVKFQESLGDTNNTLLFFKKDNHSGKENYWPVSVLPLLYKSLWNGHL